jgi:hypothetical protein
MESFATFLVILEGIVTLFGFLCFFLYILLPIWGMILHFLLIDAPKSLYDWRTSRAQQQELSKLALRIKSLKNQKIFQVTHKKKANI